MVSNSNRDIFIAVTAAIVAGMIVSPMLITPVQATGFVSSHSQLYTSGLGNAYKWTTEQDWWTTEIGGNSIINYEDHVVSVTIYNGIYYYKGENRHEITYKSPSDDQWRIATEVQFGAFWFTYTHAMTARCYNTGSVTWYDNWT